MDSNNDRNGEGFVLSTPPLLGNESEGASGLASFEVTTPKGTKFPVRKLRDVVNEVPEEREWTVKGIVPDCGLGVLGGRHKRGKSTLVLHLSRAVEAGELFLDRETRKAPVVYINYEMPLDYFVALAKGEPIAENFYVVNRPEPRLQTDTIGAIIVEMAKRGFLKGLMVIDSFRGAFKLTGEQENQSGTAGQILRVLQDIAVKHGWLIFVLHHHKKNRDSEGSENLSGTGDFGAAADVIWTWSRPADMSRPGVLEIEGRIPEVASMRVRLTPGECVYLGSANAATEEDEKQQIQAALGTQQLTAKVIAAKTDIPYSTVKKRLDSMKAENRVDSVRGSGRGSPDSWFCLYLPAGAAGTQCTQYGEQEGVLNG
jgi:hypothetical protein